MATFQLFERAALFRDSIAIRSQGQAYSYAELTHRSNEVCHLLLDGREILECERIAFLLDPSFDYVAVQWGIWKAGGIAVPLCNQHPIPALQYVLEDASISHIITKGAYLETMSPLAQLLNVPLTDFDQIEASSEQTSPGGLDLHRPAMMLYTSGTTGKPKGVVTTLGNIQAQIKTLVRAWQWSEKDSILNILPLHHVHGIVNVLSCALWSGATCQFLPRFDAQQVWNLLCSGKINLFMAVPTIYYKLISYYEDASVAEQERMSKCLATFRLMVSGSAALPVSTLEHWKRISGHILLERYGMTEIGMALSNPYDAERRPGSVGLPLPGVEVRLSKPGEIQIKGASVFREYWNKPEATTAAFTPDGWFKSGDVAVLENGYYRILGRDTVDIIKSGGYKISAIEIEEVLLKHPAINECAVVGIPDEEWGEVVGASLVTKVPLDLDLLKEKLKQELPPYQIPRKFIFQDELPRNTLGKVTKKVLRKQFD